MGRETKEMTVCAWVSRHNSEQDEKDEALWEELRRRIGEVCEEPQFASIDPDVIL